MDTYRLLQEPAAGWPEQLGQEFLTAWLLLREPRPGREAFRLTVDSCWRFGVRSLPLVMLVSLFLGAVSAWQAHYQFHGRLPDIYLGSAVFKAVVIELAPVMTALIIAGRVGAAVSAELAAMKLTEQLDALRLMGVPPLGLVGFPRALGLVLMMPLLVIFADFWGLAGGALAAVGGLHVPPASFLVEIPSHFHLYDVAAGLLKGEIFALLTAVVAVNAGISARRSSRGVGAAAVRSFVTAAVYILVSNFFVAAMVF